ncbi:MAG: GDP-L-fucose synthase [Candidatus Portnoybacteria bacterium]|nr:GDP-L-fucose synthase [Candidatus Portnoybacteria bacterium]
MALTLKSEKILLTGGAGFLGRFVFDELEKQGVKEKNIFIPRSKEYDLREKEMCAKVLKGKDIVIHLAANEGGIGYNQVNPGSLFYDNAVMGIHLMEEARKAGVKKFVTIGTICSYPKITPIPFKEKDLWNGYPEETNASHGLSKKMLLVQEQAYRQQYGFNAIHLLQVNLYGPGDAFDPSRSHVIPALIKKIYDAKKARKAYIDVWGTGRPTREFLYVEDAARGIVLATMKYNKPEPINLGSGMEISIKKLVTLICKLMDYKGGIKWDKTKPDGQPRRRLNITKAREEFEFSAKVGFEEGLKRTIEWYEQQV